MSCKNCGHEKRTHYEFKGWCADVGEGVCKCEKFVKQDDDGGVGNG